MSIRSGPELVAGLVASHGGQLQRYLLARVRDRGAVQDLIQEIYLRMLRVPDHESIRSPEAYLFTVAHHVSQQHSIRGVAPRPPQELQQMLVRLADAPNDPVLEVSAQQSVDGLQKALHGLSPRERATFLWHRRDGVPLQDIADRFKVSRHMVKKYLARAVVAFRRELARQGSAS